MNKYILFTIATLLSSQAFSEKREFSSEYIELREEMLLDSRIPYDKCNKKASYERYRKTLVSCLATEMRQKKMSICKKKAEKSIKKKKGKINQAAHCNILKPTSQVFLAKLDKTAKQKNISKYKK